MLSALAAAGIAAAALTVNVHIEFDPTITSAPLKDVAKLEAAALWMPYGVQLRWTEHAAADVSVDVIVERSQRRDFGITPVLAQATIASDDSVHRPIRISFDAVDALLASKPTDNPGLHDLTLATAIGRVLAHELGHVLLGSPGYHDRAGLMRAAFPVDDLARIERSRFKLAAFSIARLQDRIAVLARGGPDGCGGSDCANRHPR